VPRLRRAIQTVERGADVIPAADRPAAPGGARNVVVVTLDSLRFDSAMTAGMTNLARLGDIERRYSYASWTAPSHFNLLMGLLPHHSPTHVYASEYYKADFARYSDRFGVPGIEFAAMLPSLWLPTYMRNVLGYRTAAMVSMPVLNPTTPVNRDFDTYELMPSHNDMNAMLDRLTFDDDVPSFWMLNVGETHYPYAVPGDDASEWPHIAGVHGVFKHMDDAAVGGDVEPAFFDDAQMRRLRAQQVRAASYCDDLLAKLYDLVPPRTWIIVTSDHGELFGEGGYFGHGPIAHDKVLEVPFAEGVIR
jgi:arylsulfatase A-like enzyme